MTDQAQSLREMMKKIKKAETKVITITSGKGGVGKSSFALNMAIELNRRGNRVLIIDTDFGLSNIDVMLGVNTKYNLLHVINGEKDISEVIEKSSHGVRFISGGSGVYDLINVDAFKFNSVMESFKRLDKLVDIIIFDTGAGITENILRMMHASHETILITTPEPTSMMDAYALVKMAGRDEEKPNIKLVVNKAENKKEAEIALEGFVDVADKYMNLKIGKLGYILRDDKMIRAVKMQTPLMVSFPKSGAADNIEKVIDVFLDEKKTDSKGLGMASFLNKFVGKKKWSSQQWF
jgi:flagellar biosynthesis protein FlhG